ncbi:MAG: hypothetical protein HY072_00545 [Deltaproteobacteria bacterium]|nr:hypothetical protein [Deltaproteobacteria bacterium]
MFNLHCFYYYVLNDPYGFETLCLIKYYESEVLEAGVYLKYWLDGSIGVAISNTLTLGYPVPPTIVPGLHYTNEEGPFICSTPPKKKCVCTYEPYGEAKGDIFCQKILDRVFSEFQYNKDFGCLREDPASETNASNIDLSKYKNSDDRCTVCKIWYETVHEFRSTISSNYGCSWRMTYNIDSNNTDNDCNVRTDPNEFPNEATYLQGRPMCTATCPYAHTIEIDIDKSCDTECPKHSEDTNNQAEINEHIEKENQELSKCLYNAQQICDRIQIPDHSETATALSACSTQFNNYNESFLKFGEKKDNAKFYNLYLPSGINYYPCTSIISLTLEDIKKHLSHEPHFGLPTIDGIMIAPYETPDGATDVFDNEGNLLRYNADGELIRPTQTEEKADLIQVINEFISAYNAMKACLGASVTTPPDDPVNGM